jgi:hypothetical protein
VGAGIIGGLGLILVEILYHKHKIRKEKRADAAQMAITRWKGTIEVKFILTFKINVHIRFNLRILAKNLLIHGTTEIDNGSKKATQKISDYCR